MPIDNVTSTLPDAAYIAALERHIAEQDRIIEALQRDVSNLNRGRA